MDERERAAEVERLRGRLAEALARRAAIIAEARDFGTRVEEIREAFGNPYFYSGDAHGRPENADKSIETFSGYNSHEVVLPIVLPMLSRLREVDRELTRVREQLRALGEHVE